MAGLLLAELFPEKEFGSGEIKTWCWICWAFAVGSVTNCQGASSRAAVCCVSFLSVKICPSSVISPVWSRKNIHPCICVIEKMLWRNKAFLMCVFLLLGSSTIAVYMCADTRTNLTSWRNCFPSALGIVFVIWLLLTEGSLAGLAIVPVAFSYKNPSPYSIKGRSSSVRTSHSCCKVLPSKQMAV